MGAARDANMVQLRIRIVREHSGTSQKDRINCDPMTHHAAKEPEACDYRQAKLGCWVLHVCDAQSGRYTAALICTPNIPHCYAVVVHVERVKFKKLSRSVHHFDALHWYIN